MTLEIAIRSFAELRPSTYNPRRADPERLRLVELSLRKLGWLIPIYADADGEILSGHQRHYVATERMGLEAGPVALTPTMNLESRKAMNIAFNRSTNDLDRRRRARRCAKPWSAPTSMRSRRCFPINRSPMPRRWRG